MPKKKVEIGIITYNGAHRVHNLLNSIDKWKDKPEGYEVRRFLVDDGSHPDHAANSMWISKHHNIPVLFHATNRGISKSWNDICHNSDADIIILMNDDILVSENWLTCMLYFLENNPTCGTVGWNFYFIVEHDITAILESDTPIEIHRDPHDKKLLTKPVQIIPDNPAHSMVPVGCCFGFRRDVYDLVGGFDERFVSFYEEMDFSTAITSNGIANFMLPYPFLYHMWAKTFEENAEALNPAKLMNNSRRAYRDKWGGDTDDMHKKYMPLVEPREVKWLDRNLCEQSAILCNSDSHHDAAK